VDSYETRKAGQRTAARWPAGKCAGRKLSSSRAAKKSWPAFLKNASLRQAFFAGRALDSSRLIEIKILR